MQISDTESDGQPPADEGQALSDGAPLHPGVGRGLHGLVSGGAAWSGCDGPPVQDAGAVDHH